MNLEVLELSQSIILTGLREEGNSKGFHQENLWRQGLPHLMERVRHVRRKRQWILRMKMYFIIHDYSINENSIISIYNINGTTSIWWENLMQVKGIKERRIIWE